MSARVLILPTLSLESLQQQTIETQSQPNSGPGTYAVRENTETSTWITLNIGSLDASSIGTYFCTANNSRGNAEKATKICGM